MGKKCITTGLKNTKSITKYMSGGAVTKKASSYRRGGEAGAKALAKALKAKGYMKSGGATKMKGY